MLNVAKRGWPCVRQRSIRVTKELSDVPAVAFGGSSFARITLLSTHFSCGLLLLQILPRRAVLDQRRHQFGRHPRLLYFQHFEHAPDRCLPHRETIPHFHFRAGLHFAFTHAHTTMLALVRSDAAAFAQTDAPEEF